MVDVVAERAHRELGHVELAQADGAGIEEAPRRRALLRRDEVVGRARAAGGRQTVEVTEVLEGHRYAVERASPASRGRVGLEGARGLERALLVEANECVDAAVPF